MPLYQSGKAIQLRKDRKNQEGQKQHPDGGEQFTAEKIDEVYDWLDRQIRGNSNLAGACTKCGKCCDFDSFDHHLFVTTPEVMYLAEHSGAERQKPMTIGRFPYNIDGKCTIYPSRFASCRIFQCRTDTDFQNRLSELAVKKFKSICTEFQISYRYIDLETALNNLAINICQPAGQYHPECLSD